MGCWFGVLTCSLATGHSDTDDTTDVQPSESESTSTRPRHSRSLLHPGCHRSEEVLELTTNCSSWGYPSKKVAWNQSHSTSTLELPMILLTMRRLDHTSPTSFMTCFPSAPLIREETDSGRIAGYEGQAADRVDHCLWWMDCTSSGAGGLPMGWRDALRCQRRGGHSDHLQNFQLNPCATSHEWTTLPLLFEFSFRRSASVEAVRNEYLAQE